MTAAEYRAARVAAHLTQQQLATAIGVAPNTIARRERGERPVTPEAAAALLYAILKHPAVNPCAGCTLAGGCVAHRYNLANGIKRKRCREFAPHPCHGCQYISCCDIPLCPRWRQREGL